MKCYGSSSSIFDPAINFRLISFHFHKQNLLAHATVFMPAHFECGCSKREPVDTQVNLQPKQTADAQKITFNATEPSTWPLFCSLITADTWNSIANRFVHHTEHLVKHLYFLFFPLCLCVHVYAKFIFYAMHLSCGILLFLYAAECGYISTSSSPFQPCVHKVWAFMPFAIWIIEPCGLRLLSALVVL